MNRVAELLLAPATKRPMEARKSATPPKNVRTSFAAGPSAAFILFQGVDAAGAAAGATDARAGATGARAGATGARAGAAGARVGSSGAESR
jgi:hypothetical protein